MSNDITALPQRMKPGKYAILFRNNWDGEGDTYETFATLDAEGIWYTEDEEELLETDIRGAFFRLRACRAGCF